MILHFGSAPGTRLDPPAPTPSIPASDRSVFLTIGSGHTRPPSARSLQNAREKEKREQKEQENER